jgi:hypothetical protein
MTRISSRLEREKSLSEEVYSGTVGIASTKGNNNSGKRQAPEIDTYLLSYLRTVFPSKLVREMSPRQLDWSIGQQEVINHLQALWDEQNQKGK